MAEGYEDPPLEVTDDVRKVADDVCEVADDVREVADDVCDDVRVKDNPEYKPVPIDEGNRLSVIIAGKSGAGKSTLARNVLGISQPHELSASRITTEHETKTALLNGVTLKVTDTIGLESNGRQRKKALKNLYKHTEGKADLIIYCLSVSHSTKFEESNPSVMKSLQDAFGKGIWKQCILVLTFSNQIIGKLRKNCRDKDEAIAKYKDYLKEYTTKFKDELKKLKVKDIDVREEFGFQTEALSDYITAIVALPAGDEADDPVFPDFRDPTEFTIPGSKLLKEPIKIDIIDWRNIIFIEMVRKCSNVELKKKLLQYRYGKDIATTIVSGVSGASNGMVGGAAIGAGVGAAVGAVGGLFGIVPGAIAGGVAGAVIGGFVGGTGGTVTAQLRRKFRRKK